MVAFNNSPKEQDIDRAFNLGCDARLQGSITSPYLKDQAWRLHHQWVRGWRDVDKHWGLAARHRVRPLPPISVVL